tara:strand:- start:317 stop:712 length:396 start_codon:yes stop_codon:yes gene_type:complete
MKIEMEIFKARQIRMLNKVQRYFNSTPIRNAFARWMVSAFYENTLYTISHLVKEMHTNRQTISIMINECEKEDYIIVVRKGKTVSCQASQTLINKMNDYCEWRKEITELTIGKAYNELVQFEKLMSKELNV